MSVKLGFVTVNFFEKFLMVLTNIFKLLRLVFVVKIVAISLYGLMKIEILFLYR